MDRRSSEDSPGKRGGGPDWAAQDWDDLMPRLWLFTSLQLVRRGHGAPDMVAAEDLAHDAITKTIAGVRVWNREACTLFQHLAGVVVSDISHCRNSSENRLTVRRPKNANGHTTWPPDHPDQTPNQEDAAGADSDRRQLLNYLRSIDPRLAAMAELSLTHEIWETQELGERLGMTPAEVANLRKRLKRAAGAFLEEKGP
jgi:hypothetical protein